MGYQSTVLLNSTITFTYSYVLSFWKHSAHGLKVENLTVMSPQVIVIEILFWQEQLHWAEEEQHFFFQLWGLGLV